MSERMKFLVRWDSEEGNFSALCREFQISRKTGYKWLGRYEIEGPSGLEDREPIARACSHRTAEAIEDQLVVARKAHPSWGPRKVRAWLVGRDAALEDTLPAISTVGEIFKRRGLLRPRKRRLRVPIAPLPRAEAAGPNEIWSADFKGHFALGDRSRCHPLTLADVYSRYSLKCEGLAKPREEPVREQFELAFREFGLPLRMRTDNGVPFASNAPGGLTRLVVWWIQLGITPERIEPGHPEQNGRHERFHRTLKDEATKPARADLASQQRRFDEFRREYNEERPHESLEDQPPGRIYALSMRPFPATLREPEYDAETTVRRADDAGRISWRGSLLRLTRCLEDQPIGLREVADGCWEARYGPVVLGVIDSRGAKPVLKRAETKVVPEPGARGLVPGDQAAVCVTSPAGSGEEVPRH